MYNSTTRSPTSPLRSPYPPNAYHTSTDYPHQGEHQSPKSAALHGGYGNHKRERSPSSYYVATTEHRERRRSHHDSAYKEHPTNSYDPTRTEQRSPEHSHASHASSHHRLHHAPTFSPSPRPSYREPVEQYPPSPPGRPTYSRQSMAPPTQTAVERPSSAAAAPRVNDPMSFSSILSSADPDPPTTGSVSPRSVRKAPRPSSSHQQYRIEPSPTLAYRSPQPHAPMSPPPPVELMSNDKPRNGRLSPGSDRAHADSRLLHIKRTPSADQLNMDKIKLNGEPTPLRPPPPPVTKPKIVIIEKDVQAALAKIDATEHSDVETGSFQEFKHAYVNRGLKRAQTVADVEAGKRKRRRIARITKVADNFGRQALIAKEKYLEAHEQIAAQQVQVQDMADEKEHKKIMQRNRRRETQKARAEQAAAELIRKAEATEDRDERKKLMQAAHRAEKQAATASSKLLNGETPIKDIRENSPLGPNLEGGVTGSFQIAGDDIPQEPAKKKVKTGGRLKKSKEQKQAEKDAAAAAHAAMERGEELMPLAPKADLVKLSAVASLARESSGARESTPTDKAIAASRAHDLLYELIWRDIARKDIPKVVRIKDNSLSTKQSNLKKTAQLASKEARRWQLKTNKSTKDTQARAKRVMREMLGFWKRNERDERDQRKMAERQELENAKKAEAEREANRQKRKLNFLISQTELYSHFIGKKVRTDEIERSTDDADVAISEATVKGAPAAANTIDLPASNANLATKVTNFEDLDFDAEDETTLQQAAMANAQNAVKEAQDRARAFNTEGQLQSQFDDGEMNFQNPSSLQSMDVEQPKMLTCQLKEYQLKGLNWLVNLYEQGINGILADEMGLGKTVQSISVMAYLAEYHNIWGPFLVIAPASTLHNWQQEIVKFVPTLKVLPYWGNAKDRKVLRKFWDRKHITYTRDSPFHVLVTSYQLVVMDTPYFQKIRWQYMILDEAQAIKSSQSSRWKALLGFHCRNRLLLTGTPIQNNMQELWALLHFIMPSLFDSHDEFSDWFSKDIESHAQSNTKLNEDQLKRLHMILKPFMLRRIKKHVQKELGDKIELDVFCDLTYRQRAYYLNLRNKISIMDLIEKAAIGDDQDTATLMNLVMQFRKVCNHPDLFERADTASPVAFSYFGETASFLREGHTVDVGYSVRNLIEYRLPRLLARKGGRLELAGPDNTSAGWKQQLLYHTFNVWSPVNLERAMKGNDLFSWLRFIDTAPGQASEIAFKDPFQRAVDLFAIPTLAAANVSDVDGKITSFVPPKNLLNIVLNKRAQRTVTTLGGGVLDSLMNISASVFNDSGIAAIEPCARPAVSAPPIEMHASTQHLRFERARTLFNPSIRSALYGISEQTELALLEAKISPSHYPTTNLLPAPISNKARYTPISVPSMRRFVTDSGKLAKLDTLLHQLKEGNHRVLLYFQMTRMIDLMEEYLTYRNYKYCRLDGSTKLEDRRDTVADFQSRPDIFIFLLSTRAGGLGINLTAADTVIFYDSDWNPTIDSQAMDRAHRLGQTRQVTVYRLITRGTIEERIRKRALQKEEVQRVVISGGSAGGVDFNTRSRENRTKDIAMWLADDDQAEMIEKKEAEIAEKEAKGEKEVGGGRKRKNAAAGKKGKDVSMDDMYHEGEGHFDDNSGKPSGAATPVVEAPAGKGKRKGISKKAKSIKEKLAVADGIV